MPRLFTALEVPADGRVRRSQCCGAACRARAGSIQRTITSPCASSATWTTHWRVRSPIELDRVKRAGFELRVDGLSSFGGRKPRAVIASVPPIAPLVELQAEHERLLQRVGLEPEGRKFTPHVTLARLRESSNRQVADYLAVRGPFRSPPFPVSRFVLYSARAAVGGGPYIVEADYPWRREAPCPARVQRSSRCTADPATAKAHAVTIRVCEAAFMLPRARDARKGSIRIATS